MARAGRYLREILDPGVSDRESEADQGRRFLRVRPMGSGGVEGEFRLPREAAARLRAWLDAYARPGVVGDDRPLRVRSADALIALLDSKVTTELLVLVPAESLPDDHPANPANAANSGPVDPANAANSGPADPGNSGPVDVDPAVNGHGSGRGDGDRGDRCGWCGHGPNRAAPGLLLATGQLL
ncbi:DUF222 domain-containing protein, partial [Planotetraspora kaengkrachanensis]|uniref:DUF222 domain-containing protein n=1 Tax=Planotetraspora kaengkrachanensis TaxID=575193 RepID=UPI003CD0C2CA